MSSSPQRLAYLRERYRRQHPTVRQKHAPHVCSTCEEPGHNAKTCKRCVDCGRPAEFLTNRGWLCQRCLEMAA